MGVLASRALPSAVGLFGIYFWYSACGDVAVDKGLRVAISPPTSGRLIIMLLGAVLSWVLPFREPWPCH